MKKERWYCFEGNLRDTSETGWSAFPMTTVALQERGSRKNVGTVSRETLETQFLSCCDSTYNCLSTSAPERHQHVAGTLSKQPTKTQ